MADMPSLPSAYSSKKLLLQQVGNTYLEGNTCNPAVLMSWLIPLVVCLERSQWACLSMSVWKCSPTGDELDWLRCATLRYATLRCRASISADYKTHLSTFCDGWLVSSFIPADSEGLKMVTNLNLFFIIILTCKLSILVYSKKKIKGKDNICFRLKKKTHLLTYHPNPCTIL